MIYPIVFYVKWYSKYFSQAIHALGPTLDFNYGGQKETANAMQKNNEFIPTSEARALAEKAEAGIGIIRMWPWKFFE